jgi:ATP-dependent helicase/DNAse subunit B
MTAIVRIVCGPASSGKTEHLLERFREWARSAPGAALWLGPTRRSVEALRERLSESRGEVVLTFQQFAEEIIRVNDSLARPLTNAQRRLLVDEILSTLHSEGELAPFGRVLDTRGFHEGVTALLKELRRAGVSAAQFARAAYRRGSAGNQPGRRIGSFAIGAKDRPCARLYARYLRELRRQKLHDLEGRAWHANDLLRRGSQRPFTEVRAVFVDDFADFTPAQHALLVALSNWVEELWITLPDESSEERAELFSRSRETLKRLQCLNPQVVYLSRPPGPLPPGLAHLERQLFRPPRAVEIANEATGLACIEAPGVLGEVRLIARQIKGLLLDGVPADDMIVTVRDLAPYADLVREVFAEYGIPLDVEGTEPLSRNPAVAVLLRALRLPEDDWPFGPVTTLLRSTYFRLQWAEIRDRSDVPQCAEVLLRLLGEPRGRDAYRAAVTRWAEQQQPGLEDEQAEESRRRRIHELAQQCRPFLERFFRSWDEAPASAPLTEHAAWLRRFAEDFGIACAASEADRDGAALERLWAELDHWLRRERRNGTAERPLDRKTFQRRLGALAAEAGLARTPRGPGRVRVLSAELARHLSVPYVFVLGLGERGFPRLTVPQPLFDEAERQSYKQAGVDFAGAADRMPDEMLLFYQVVTRARRGLVLSYPAVDERGQALLPSSFLSAILDCFRPGAVPVERRSMLIERYESDIPLSPAEYRVRAAATRAAGGLALPGLSADLRANLIDSANLVRLRFLEKEHNPYDGLFRDEAVIAELHQLFGPERVFSPTALEDYVACPFRFFLRHVLRLEPLEEPREEIEVTRRGQAFHRALARLHRNLHKAGVHEPTEAVDAEVLREINAAVEEDVRRAPSLASKELWRLEGRRLLRVAARYRDHWQKFLAPWRERGVAPKPHFFEVDFGLPSTDGTEAHGPLIIRAEGVEVHISGRIDRVDVAELEDGVGFWIIDYKTGRSSHYTSTDLAEYRRLQLTLYALAVEEVLLADRGARPLGLAYWLVTESGPKVALPTRNQVLWLDEHQRWRAVRGQLEGWVAKLVSNIRGGVFPLQPRSENCTQTCPYGQVCRITQARSVDKAWHLPLPGGEGGANA